MNMNTVIKRQKCAIREKNIYYIENRNKIKIIERDIAV